MPTIPIDLINIGVRIREDMGDIAGLAESIQLRGLLHPIIVDESNNLIAGHRRLEAHKLLGRTDIEARTMADLSEKEKRLIELEENTKRKALTEFEASKNLMDLAEAASEVLKEEFPSRGDEKPKPEGGRPEKPDSREKVAERLGVSTGAITEARQHVAAVEQYPALEAVPKKEAIKTAKDAEKAEAYQKAVTEFPQLKESKLPVDAVISAAEKLRKVSPEVQKATFEKVAEVDRKSALRQQLIEETYQNAKRISDLISVAMRMGGVVTEERFECWLGMVRDHQELQLAISNVQRGIDELNVLKDKIKVAMKGPRKVVRGRGK